MLIPIGHENDSTRRLARVSITYVVLCVAVFILTSAVPNAGSGAGQQALDYFIEHPYLEPDPVLRDAAWGDSADEAIDALRDASGPRPASGARRKQQKELDRLTATWRQEQRRSPTYKWGLVPADFSILNLVSSIFMHAGILHLVGNMLFLWLSGPPLEDVWGRPLFAAFYLVAGVVANLFWIASYPDSQVPLVGASGAVAGLMGAFMVRFWSSRIRIFYFVGFFGIFKAPAWLMLGLWFGREVMSSTSDGGGGGVAYLVHVGGFAFGAAVAWSIRHFKFEKRVLAPVIEQQLGGEANPVIEEAHELRQEGRREEALRLLQSELQKHPENADAAIALWDVAIELRRPRDGVAPLLRVIQQEMDGGDPMLAHGHWSEIEAHLPNDPLPFELRISLAEALMGDGYEEAAIQILGRARKDLRADVTAPWAMRLARAVTHLGLPDAAEVCQLVMGRGDISDEMRAELQQRLGRIELFGTRSAFAPAAATTAAAPAVASVPETVPAAANLTAGIPATAPRAEAPSTPVFAPSPPPVSPAAAPVSAPEAPAASLAAPVPAPPSIRPPPAKPPPPRPTPAPIVPPLSRSEVPPPRKADAACWKPVDHLRKIVPAVLSQVLSDRIFVKLSSGKTWQVPLTLIRAVATAQIHPFAPGAQPFQVIDLLVAPPSGPPLTIRTPAHAFDPRAFVAEETDRDRALVALIDYFLAKSGAVPLPDACAVRGQPLATFPSLELYQAELCRPR